jgi:hypothetical protein
MKKIFIVLTLFSVLTFTSVAKASEVLVSTTNQEINLPPNVYDANSLQIHMRKNLYYGEDRVIPGYFEYFQLPPILEFSRIGDCDDFSTYTWYYLSLMNYHTKRYILFLEYGEETVGHAVTLFLDNDKTYSVFSNQQIFKTQQTNPIDAIKDVYPTWKIIFTWNATKYGYLTVSEVYADIIPVDFININVKASYYWEKMKDMVLDYVDY